MLSLNYVAIVIHKSVLLPLSFDVDLDAERLTLHISLLFLVCGEMLISVG